MIADNLEPLAVYDADELSESLGISTGSIDTARKDGLLRSAKIGRSYRFLGQWVIDWFEAIGEPKPIPANASTDASGTIHETSSDNTLETQG